MDNSSACLIWPDGPKPGIELALSERLNRKKASGAWPEAAIRLLAARLGNAAVQIAENREIFSTEAFEGMLDEKFPFYDYLRRENLGRYSRHFNPDLKAITHHLCHATAAKLMSPFTKALIVVMDGAGSMRSEFAPDHPEVARPLRLAPFMPSGPEVSLKALEECSVYLLDAGKLDCVYKRWQVFAQNQYGDGYGEGPGLFFENAAKFIFHCKLSAGKVMGLAPFGRATPIQDRRQYLDSLDRSLAFPGGGKARWEASPQRALYTDVAATVQASFEESLLALLSRLRELLPEYSNLILTGGCALNCSANAKILGKNLFEKIYVPPFPGDECIGLGAAASLYYASEPDAWSPLPFENQHGYFGPVDSLPSADSVLSAFAGFSVTKPPSITDYAADLLDRGKIIAWFQGRSESGPRALGNRSILASPKIPGLKDQLNGFVKFRESFRPYGASVLREFAPEYFHVAADFDSPFMSFAVRTRADYRALLQEVTHVDGTSRIQTVRTGQNSLFAELLRKFGEKSGLFCLLNTSLNVMGEPMVESVADARAFLVNVPVDGIAIGDFFIKRETGRSP